MPSYAQQLARLRVALDTGRLPPDLGRWALEQAMAQAQATDRIEARNALIVAAADLLSGSTWSRAMTIAAELVTAERERMPTSPVRVLLARALEIHPCPRSTRQILRILETD